MLKLYKKTSTGVDYWEAWQDDNMLVVHSGALGQIGETSRVPYSRDAERIVTNRIAWLQSHDYTEVQNEALFAVAIQYQLNNWGSSADLEKRHKIEELLDDRLGWTGLGHCTGGEIGSGSMDIFCGVVDPFVALEAILATLRQNDFLEGAVVAVKIDDDFKVLWPETFALSREHITKLVLSAHSLPDVLKAQQVLRAWIEKHPEDEGMRDGFEQLSLMQNIAEEELAR